jgi:hypothetical protein
MTVVDLMVNISQWKNVLYYNYIKNFFMYCRTLKKTCEKSPVTINIDPLQQEAENQVFLKTCEKSPVTGSISKEMPNWNLEIQHVD